MREASIGAAAALASLVATASFPVSAQQIYEAEVEVPVQLIAQQTNAWCWAASGQMAMAYFGIVERQCYQAFIQFGQNKRCCNLPPPGGCVQPGMVIIGDFGFTYAQLGPSAALTEAQIEAQIWPQTEPWIMNPNNGTAWGHVMVGVSYIDLSNIVPNVLLVGVDDPWPPGVGDFYFETYDAYAAGVWEGVVHTEGYDIYDIEPPTNGFNPGVGWISSPQAPPPSLPPELVARVQQGDPSAERAAADAWTLLRQLITENRARKLGFRSPAEARALEISAPVPQYGISLQRIRNWTSNQSILDVLDPQPALLVPLQVRGQTLATLRLRQDKGDWRLATFGHSGFAKAWRRLEPGPSSFLVEIEAFELAFVGRRSGNRVYLSPLMNDARFQLVIGRERPVEEIMPLLALAATHYRANVLTPLNK